MAAHFDASIVGVNRAMRRLKRVRPRIVEVSVVLFLQHGPIVLHLLYLFSADAFDLFLYFYLRSHRV